jgi:hypothetical protein
MKPLMCAKNNAASAICTFVTRKRVRVIGVHPTVCFPRVRNRILHVTEVRDMHGSLLHHHATCKTHRAVSRGEEASSLHRLSVIAHQHTIAC